jgi:hypothetical protein
MARTSIALNQVLRPSCVVLKRLNAAQWANQDLGSCGKKYQDPIHHFLQARQHNHLVTGVVIASCTSRVTQISFRRSF